MANFADNLKLLHSLSTIIPEYDGNQSTLSDFISACSFVFEQIDENLQPGFLFVVKNKLIGPAKQFISSRSLNDWESVRQLLIGHFGDCRDTESLLRDLTACVQKPNETPRSFVQRIENLLTKLRNAVSLDATLTNDTRPILNLSHEKIALKTLLAGLSDPMGPIIRSQKPASIDEAINFILEEENIYYLKNKNAARDSKHVQKVLPRSNFHNDQKKEIKVCNYCKNRGHVISECRKRAFNNRQNFSNANNSDTPVHTTRPFNGNNSYTNHNPNNNRHNQPNNNYQGNFNRPSVIQRNPAVNHLNSQLEASKGDSPLDFRSPQEQMNRQLHELSF